jgi:DNA-binding IclR family transcriptional regulator
MRLTERDNQSSMISRISAVVGAFRPEEPVLSASEIARRVGVPKASTARIVRDLVEYDFLERTPGGYRVGIKCFELGQLAQKPKDLRRMALATMADLRQATGLTVQLGVLDGADVVYIEILRGKHADLVIPSRVGGRVAAYATAGGKALLAFSGEAVVQRAVVGGMRKIGPNTLASEESLRTQLATVRDQGIAYEQEESSAGLACAASPILRGDSSPVAAISITAPVGTMDMRLVGPAVQTATLGLNRQLRASTVLNQI